MRVAILGATGAVGRTMLRVLEERSFPVEEIVPLASSRSAGSQIAWRGRQWTVREPEHGIFEGCDIALFSAGGARSREWAPIAAAEGAVVVDNSSAWRKDPDVPLVVPEINGARVVDRPKGIIANPNCSTIQTVVALEALRRAAGLRRVVATTFQSVSGAGESGITALRRELEGEVADGSPFPARIAHNVIPRIGPLGDTGFTEEEEKMRHESRRILELPELSVAATCVRVPVEIGHCVEAAVELERPLTTAEAYEALASMPGVEVARGEAPDPLPIDIAGTDLVRVGRVRVDPDLPNVLHLWIVGDNLRKGAATNTVQIAERIANG